MQTDLITGASSGIGEAFAHELAARGDRLILVARREDRLNALATDLHAKHGVECVVIAADLSLADSAAKLFAETERRGLSVDLLINNAGFGKYGALEAHPLAAYDEMIQLNVTALVDLSYLYLAGMRARKHGGILNVASVAGFPPTPYLAVYGATKAFVVSFSQALAVEAADAGIRVSVLCPGSTISEFQVVAGGHTIAPGTRGYLTSAQVAHIGLRGLDSGKVIVVSGLFNKLEVVGISLMPRSIVRRIAGMWGKT